MSKASIHNVAERAGVSIKTVSRVINREPNVRDDTKRRVEEAIEVLSYTPNQFARRLAGNRAFVIGLLFDNPNSSYLMDIQRGALRVCQREHYDVLLHPCAYEDIKLPAEARHLLDKRKIDGFLLTPPLADHQPLLASLRQAEARFVRITPGDRIEAARSVFTNDRDSCARMTSHLVSLGHRSIGFILGHPYHKAMADRYRGYASALESAGIPLDQRLLKQGSNTFESGVACARELLGEKYRPTAVFAGNDEMAFGVIRVAHECGLRVPQDLSVVGFDDIPMSQHVFPALTTVRQPVEEMAMKATELLIGDLRGDTPAEDAILLESVLQIRESVGPAPA